MGRILSLGVLMTCFIAGLQARELDWVELQPEGWHLDKESVFEGQDISQLSDFSPEAIHLMDRLQAVLDAAPPVAALEGQKITLEGYLLPLTRREGRAQRFFLVPFFGTCIHTPPPPANQIVDVHFPEGTPYSSFFSEVRVTGILTLETYSHRLATSAYRLDAERVEKQD